METLRVAQVLGFVETLCGSMSSASAHRMAAVLEACRADLDTLTTADLDDDDRAWVLEGLGRVSDDTVTRMVTLIERLRADSVSIITAGTLQYPLNLRLVPNRPPLLFLRGALTRDDGRAVAVVGTRDASAAGLRTAGEVARRLARAGVCVVSGLADGIDTAAHHAALDAGGRSVAVYGTGIDRVFPTRNRALATRIATAGACVSQWWPNQPGTKWTFPLRNIVTSGLSMGTVVIEASATSGARLQANEARRHGRRVFVVRDLVNAQPWAAELVGQPGVHLVEHVREITDIIDSDLSAGTLALL